MSYVHGGSNHRRLYIAMRYACLGKGGYYRRQPRDEPAAEPEV